MVLLVTQGWGGPAVQYRQSTPVLENLVPVTDWRSTFCDPLLDWERQSLQLGEGPVLLLVFLEVMLRKYRDKGWVSLLKRPDSVSN